MRKRSNVFLGALLVSIGAIFLALNYDLIDFDYSFRQIAGFWPVLLILAGVAVLMNEKRSFYNPTTALLVAFAIPLGIYSAASDGVHEFRNEFRDEFHFDWDDDDHDWKSDNSDGDNNYDYGSDEVEKGDRVEQKFNVSFDDNVEEATLNFGGGAAEFHLKSTDDNLFEATTLLNRGSYRLSDERKSGKHEIDFEMKSNSSKGFNFGDNDNHNEIFLALNERPVWNIELGIGAGDLNFDLSAFKIKDLEIKTGAAAIDVKLGDRYDNVSVDVESGVASIEISIPESVGCEIKMNGALNSKDFDGFNNEGNSRWRTSNFDSADKKVYIEVSSALSSVSVDRY